MIIQVLASFWFLACLTEVEALCPANGELNSPRGAITSPNYPHNYGVNSHCSWLIDIAPGSRISVSFSAFSLEGPLSCVYDYVELLDGDGPESTSLGKFCGSNLTAIPSPITSSSNTLRLVFNSDYSNNYPGFSLEYKTFVTAVLGDMSVSLTPVNSGWVVTGSVPIIKVYSSEKQYRCVWARNHDTGQYVDISINALFQEDNPSQDDRSGSCEYIGALPVVTGTYTYRVTVSPGAVVRTSTIRVEAPPAPSITCSPNSQYVSGDKDVTCTCSGAVGTPQGRLMWVRRDVNNVDTTLKTGTAGDTSLQLTMAVKRSDDGVRLRCDVDWHTDVTGPSHIVNVAYGPDNATISGDAVFYTDGSRDLGLTCDPIDTNPTSGLTYTWTGRCSGSVTNRCTFRPRPPGVSDTGDDVGANIECSVRNPQNNNREARATYGLQLKYPPREAPKINGYVNNQILYQGDALTLTCTAFGGDPAVTNVTLTCTSRLHGSTPGQTSSLIVTSLTAGDHGAVCTCMSAWVREDLYTQTDSRTLNVYSPPSLPVITREDDGTRPYLEKDNVTLNCAVTSSGYPAATLTWSDRDAVLSSAVTSSTTLRLVSVGQRDDLRTLTCRAENAFTQHVNVTLEKSTTLRVSYSEPAQWTDEPADGSLQYACAGDTVRLPWNVTLSAGQTLGDVQWFYQGGSSQMIAVLTRGAFLPLPAFSHRVAFLPSAGLVLSGVSVHDSGNYSVEVNGHEGSGGFFKVNRTVTLQVGADLMTTDGVLHVRENPVAVLDKSSGQWSVELQCGAFTYLGRPPFDVQWTTPTGRLSASSSYSDGQFRLLLPAPLTGGSYHCRVPLSAFTAACLASNNTQKVDANYKLDKTESRLTLLETHQKALQNENDVLKAENSRLKNADSDMFHRVHQMEATWSSQVSFHAHNLLNTSAQIDSPLIVDDVTLNQGDCYSASTGMFTASANGTYFFIGSSGPLTSGPSGQLELRGGGGQREWLVSARALSDQGGAVRVQGVVHMQSGDRAWLQLSSPTALSGAATSFTGFLVSPDP